MKNYDMFRDKRLQGCLCGTTRPNIFPFILSILKANSGFSVTYPLHKGDSYFLPADIGEYKLTGNVTVILSEI